MSYRLLLYVILSAVLLSVTALVAYRCHKIAASSRQNPWVHAVLGGFAYYFMVSSMQWLLGPITWMVVFLSDAVILVLVIPSIIQLASCAIIYRLIFPLREIYLAVDANPRMSVARQLFSFNGRSGRRDFLVKGVLPLLGINIVLCIFSLIPTYSPNSVMSPLILGLWPLCAVYIKRLRDRDRAPWWLLFALIPIVGEIWLSIETWFLKGTTGPNRYGPDPVAQDVQSGADR